MVEETRLSADEKTEVGSNNIMDTATDNKEPHAGSGSINGNPVEQEPQYPGAAKLTLIISSLCLAIFLVALDQTIIAPALGAITAQFQSVKDIGWYGSAYLLTTTALQPMYGTIYKYFNVKIAYLVAVFIFEIGSLISAVAPSSVAFIVGRAIAGVCRPSPPLSSATLTDSFQIGTAGLFSGSIVILSLISMFNFTSSAWI
jgi:MFS family permease